MTEKIWEEQSDLTKEYDADSVAIQKLRKSKFYTIIKGDFTLQYDTWFKEGHVTFSFYYRDLEIRVGRYESKEVAIPRLKKLWAVMTSKLIKDSQPQEVEHGEIEVFSREQETREENLDI
jgi:hypothetical protein